MKKLLKRVLPGRAFALLKATVVVPIRLHVLVPIEVRREYRADRDRFLKYMVRSGVIGHRRLDEVNTEAQLTKDYHAIEKGMSLPEVRRPFGHAAVERINALLPLVDPKAEHAEHARTARESLAEWNAGGGSLDSLSPVIEKKSRGVADPEAFFGTRHSVRNFDNRMASRDDLERAVSLAMRTPSVCNRQSWRVRFYQGEQVAKVLTFQNGNRGFSESISTVAVVTVDARNFTGVIERNQPWIDGGLFAMSLVWALHSLGLDTCMLNLSLTNDTAGQMRRSLRLSDAELPITMIAIGHAAEGARRSRSPRKVIDAVMISATDPE